MTFSNIEKVGCTKFYPAFSCVSILPHGVLNDLFVSQDHRNKAIKEALLPPAKALCTSQGCRGLLLETVVDNQAQKIIQKDGLEKRFTLFSLLLERKTII